MNQPPIDIAEVIETYYNHGFFWGSLWGALFGAILTALIIL